MISIKINLNQGHSNQEEGSEQQGQGNTEKSSLKEHFLYAHSNPVTPHFPHMKNHEIPT